MDTWQLYPSHCGIPTISTADLTVLAACDVLHTLRSTIPTTAIKASNRSTAIQKYMCHHQPNPAPQCCSSEGGGCTRTKAASSYRHAITRYEGVALLAGNVGFLNVKKWLNRQTRVSAQHVTDMSADMSATQPKTVSAKVLTMSSQHVAYGYVGNMLAL
jgi:hypothetical protein